MLDRDNLEKPDAMSDENWEIIKQILEQTTSVGQIRGDAKADVERFRDNPEGWSTGAGSPSGLPTLLLSCIGRKSGEKRSTPLVFLQHGENMVVVGSLAGYDSNPAWYLNVSADPKCWVQLDHNELTAVARDATDEEREELWPALIAVFPPWEYFQLITDRPFPIVVLSPTGPA